MKVEEWKNRSSSVSRNVTCITELESDNKKKKGDARVESLAY